MRIRFRSVSSGGVNLDRQRSVINLGLVGIIRYQTPNFRYKIETSFVFINSFMALSITFIFINKYFITDGHFHYCGCIPVNSNVMNLICGQTEVVWTWDRKNNHHSVQNSVDVQIKFIINR